MAVKCAVPDITLGIPRVLNFALAYSDVLQRWEARIAQNLETPLGELVTTHYDVFCTGRRARILSELYNCRESSKLADTKFGF